MERVWFQVALLLFALTAQALDEPALARALALGRGQRLDTLRDFHADYHVVPAQPTVMELDVITLYRRAVLLSEQASRLGDRWTTRDLARELVPHLNRIAVHANVRLHPQNALVTPPPYTVELRDQTERQILPLEVDRDALYPPRVPRYGAPMSAVSLEAVFEITSLDVPNCCDVLILDHAGVTILRQPVPFGRFR